MSSIVSASTCDTHRSTAYLSWKKEETSLSEKCKRSKEMRKRGTTDQSSLPIHRPYPIPIHQNSS